MSTAVLEKTKVQSRNVRDTLKGIMPPFTMPFDKRGDVVFSAIKEQVDFAVDQGVDGIVVGGSTGEGHTLGADEFTKVMRTSYDALAGRKPFDAPSTPALLAHILKDKPVALAALRTDIDQELAAIVERSLEKDPRARFATAEEMAAALAVRLFGSGRQRRS